MLMFTERPPWAQHRARRDLRCLVTVLLDSQMSLRLREANSLAQGCTACKWDALTTSPAHLPAPAPLGPGHRFGQIAQLPTGWAGCSQAGGAAAAEGKPATQNHRP